MKILLFSFLSTFFFLRGVTQISEKGTPYLFINPSFEEFDESIITAPTKRYIESISNSEKSSYCVGIQTNVNLNPINNGSWINHKDGSRSWVLKITSANAIGLSLNYKSFIIPTGAEVFLYNESKTHVIGKFTSLRNEINPITHTQIIEGETTIIEYYEPANCNNSFNFEIESVVHYFRGFEDYLAPFKNNSTSSRAESCQIDVACSEGDDWSKQIDAVVHFTFVQGNLIYVCSGSVINNTNQDCKPYILTAWHCGEHTANQNLNNYTWYWNYQKSNCQPSNNGNNPSKGNQTMINGTVISTSGSGTLNNPPSNSDQLAGSDFTLVEMTSNIPDSYNAFYSGWDNLNSAASSGVSIHHPDGSAKKISTFNSYLQSYSYNGGAANAHWGVNWVETENGHGVTEPGSSGSPIFNQEGRIVGQLSGGNSYCDLPNEIDLYGKFSTSWDNNGNNSNAQLAPWLNPNDSNLTFIDGIYFSCEASSDFSTANFGSLLNFTGEGNSTISEWEWNFDVNELGGVNPPVSDEQNPSNILFDNAGNYLVSLTTTNTYGNSCTSLINITIINNTSISSLIKNDITIFPNPNNGSFTIQFGNDLFDKSIYICDQIGKVVKHIDPMKGFNQHFRNFKPGIYYIQSKNNILLNKKIVIL